MTSRLRRKFILSAMLAVTFVLVVMIGAINVANYLNVICDAESKIDLIAENGGSFPGFRQDGKAAGGHAPTSEGDDTVEIPYETRFFTVTFAEDGSVISADTSRIVAKTEAQAAEFAQGVADSGATAGFAGIYRFRAVDVADLATTDETGASADGAADTGATDSTSSADGATDTDAAGTDAADAPSSAAKTMYIFLNCSRDLGNFQSFLLASVGVSAVGWLLVLALVAVLSGIVIKPVAESYEKQKRFITDASHEIKTPLAVIDAAGEVLEIEHGASEWTESIHKQVARLSALTERLVFLARMDEGALGFSMKMVDVSEAVSNAAEPFFAVAAARGRTLELHVDEGVVCKGDELALMQIIELLLDNATRYSSEGSRIELFLRRKGKRAVISVRNVCDRLPEGDLDQLFERFYRDDASRSSETGGSGVGLSIVRAIAEIHGGTATASAEGDTITFTVTI